MLYNEQFIYSCILQRYRQPTPFPFLLPIGGIFLVTLRFCAGVELVGFFNCSSKDGTPSTTSPSSCSFNFPPCTCSKYASRAYIGHAHAQKVSQHPYYSNIILRCFWSSNIPKIMLASFIYSQNYVGILYLFPKLCWHPLFIPNGYMFQEMWL